MKNTHFTTSHYTVYIKYVEFNPNLYERKLLSAVVGQPKPLADFYNSVSGADAAINGGLFQASTGYSQMDLQNAYTITEGSDS